MTTALKTPVSFLQEFCVKNKIIPEYQVVNESSTVQEPSFECEVKCDKYVTKGQGRTKKEAKHVAAENMLAILRKAPEFNLDLVINMTSTVNEKRNLLPYENKFVRDAVGPLNDFCFENKLSLPVYHEVREEGPAHARMFTHRCSVETLEVESTDRQKKQAKQQVALQMITFLKETIDTRINQEICSHSGFNIQDTAYEDFNEILEQFSNCETSYVTKFQPGDLNHPFITDFTRYQDYNEDIKKAWDEFADLEADSPEAMLAAVLLSLGKVISLFPLKNINEGVMLLLSVSLTPELNICETGSSYVVAFHKAVLKALKYIKILCAKPANKSPDLENSVNEDKNGENNYTSKWYNSNNPRSLRY